MVWVICHNVYIYYLAEKKKKSGWLTAEKQKLWTKREIANYNHEKFFKIFFIFFRNIKSCSIENNATITEFILKLLARKSVYAIMNIRVISVWMVRIFAHIYMGLIVRKSFKRKALIELFFLNFLFIVTTRTIRKLF